MANSIQLRTKKASFILAVTVIIYSVIGTYLYVNHQINLMKYSTPFVLGMVGVIISFGILQHRIYRFLSKKQFIFSFEQPTESVPLVTEQTSAQCNDEEKPTVQEIVRSTLTDGYEARLAEIERKKIGRKADVMRAIHEYTTFVTAEYFTKENLETLQQNIENLALGQFDELKPIRSKFDNPISSIDIRHFTWNIGERLNLPLIDRATFIFRIFPHELGNATLDYLAKNLRTSNPCKIPIDKPEKGDYHFNCMKKSEE